MGRENIGSITEWEPGYDTDWAYSVALSFLSAALGDPPPGVTVDVTYQDHDLGSYPTLTVSWPDGGWEPWEFIHRAEEALAELDNAIDWSRIRPSRFIPDDESDVGT